MSDGSEKDTLLELLGKVPGQCEELEARARDILRLSREARDAARYQEVVVKVLQENAPAVDEYRQRSIRGWREFGQAARQLRKIPLSSLRAVVSGNTTTAAVGPASMIGGVSLAADARTTIEQAESDYSDTARLDQTFEDIKAEMKRLKLDSGKARYRNPLDLLEEAYLAIRYPASATGGASAALLTLRGSIERSIEELLRRRPVQEAAGNRRDRVLSIGRHCGKNGLVATHFDDLAANDGYVNDELSGKEKKAVVRSPGLLGQFLRGVQLLRALLASIDESRLEVPQ